MIYGIFSILVVAALFVYARFVEPYWLRKSEHHITDPALNNTIRIAHLSDFHYHSNDPRRLRCLEKAIVAVERWRPDIICCTGDFITCGLEFDAAALTQELSRLAAIAPTFAVLGNHDGGVWASRRSGKPSATEAVARMLADAGVELLHNRSIPLTINHRRVHIVGVGDSWAEQMDPVTAFQGVSTAEETVLLSHNPDTKDYLNRFPWRLMLSGHTHGGECVLFRWAPLTPVYDRRYRLGLKAYQDRWIHVTAGVGTLTGLRFGCRPEVALVVL